MFIELKNTFIKKTINVLSTNLKFNILCVEFVALLGITEASDEFESLRPLQKQRFFHFLI